ncbi:Arc family DNA-binding protein [Aeromonas jandaei]|uniref:Arc family DNA-binding protein n=1 Tax=Aeromonas jandaei TaxID=650 RepID=UPI00067D9001|nr:Arc family DNA-binding protein [Aeromonas jandaei]
MMKKSTAPTGRTSDKFMLRLPDGMRDTISELAKASGRSMNAEIVHRLQQSIDASFTAVINSGIGSPRMIASVEITDPGIDKDDPRYNAAAIAEQIKEVREMLETLSKEMKSKKG